MFWKFCKLRDLWNWCIQSGTYSIPLCTVLSFWWGFPSYMTFPHLSSFWWPFLWCKCLLLLDSITMLLFLSSFFASGSWQLHWCNIVYCTELDKDLCIMSLLGDHLLDSLASLVSLLKISELTIRSKCEHKYRGIWTRNICFYKENFPLKMKSYVISYGMQ